MSKIRINGNIIGNHNHIGDNYYLYSKSFLSDSERKFTETEIELLDLIFKEAPTEEERKQILESLKEIDKQCDNNSSFWTKVTGYLKTTGKEVLVGIITSTLTNLLLNP